MKLSTFISALAWISLFGILWICILSNNWGYARVFSMVFSFLVGIFSATAGADKKAK